MRSIFLALTITTAYALLRGWPEELHPVLRACFAVLVLVLGIGLWRKRERPNCSQARAVRAPRWPDYLAIGMGVLGVECLFLFFLSVVPHHAETLAFKVEETLRPERAKRRANTMDPGGGTHGAVISGNWLWDSQGERKLPLSSDARPSQKPEMFFRPTDDATSAKLLRSRPYIRAFAMEKYKDSAWLPVGLTPELLLPNEKGFVQLEQPENRPGPVLRGEIIQFYSGNEFLFNAPQGAIESRVDQLRKIDPGIFRLNPPADLENGYTYEVASKTVTLASLLQSGVLPEFIFPKLPDDSHLLELPKDEALRDEIISLSSKATGNAASRLIGLRKLLWDNFEYSLKIDNVENKDPMTNFLALEKRGHCEFFATAGALLCRAQNIPARVAYGWSGGKWYAGPGYFMFRAREAHAWTEIYLEGVGWVVFDTTPPSGRARIDIATADEESPLDQESGQADIIPPILGFVGGQLWLFLALAAGLALFPLAFFILKFRRKPVGMPGGASEGLLPDPPGYLSRFRIACANRGRPMEPGRTLRQQLATLAEDENQAPPFGDDLLEYHYAITYGNAKPNKLRESALTRAIKRWT